MQEETGRPRSGGSRPAEAAQEETGRPRRREETVRAETVRAETVRAETVTAETVRAEADPAAQAETVREAGPAPADGRPG